MSRSSTNCDGFTLIEMIMVITITGVLAGIVAVFITAPVQGYVDSVRRAELTDQADVALRRIARDVRLALPNSIRVSGNSCIEFIYTKDGGRYRDSINDGSTGGMSLTSGTGQFDVLGTSATNMASNMAKKDDFVVAYNEGEASATYGLDAYSGENRAAVSSSNTNTITLTTNPFGTNIYFQGYRNARFQVVPASEQAVSYVCLNGELRRYKAYGFNASQNCPPTGGSYAVLAGSSTAQPKATCVIDYTSAVMPRVGLLFVELTLTDTLSSESVTLFNEIHVDNAP